MFVYIMWHCWCCVQKPKKPLMKKWSIFRGHSLISWRFFRQFSPPTYLCWRPDDASRLDLPTYADAWPADVFPVFTFSKLCLVLLLYIFIFEKCQLASGSGTYLPMLTPRWRFLLEPTYLSSRQLINEWPLTVIIIWDSYKKDHYPRLTFSL